MPFEYLDGLTTADVAFRAEGGTLEEVFAAAWEATLGVMIEPGPGDGLGGGEPAGSLSDLRPRVRRRIRLEDQSPEHLLHAFLEEQLFLKDAEGLLLRLQSCRVERKAGRPGGRRNDRWRVRATAAGECAAPERHRLGTDVKAVTWHRFSLQPGAGGWQATVILDV